PWCDTCGAAPALSPASADPRQIAHGRSCAACEAAPPSYDYARSAAVYEGQLREALHALKFSGRRALAAPLGELAAEQSPAAPPARRHPPIPRRPGPG